MVFQGIGPLIHLVTAHAFQLGTRFRRWTFPRFVVACEISGGMRPCQYLVTVLALNALGMGAVRPRRCRRVTWRTSSRSCVRRHVCKRVRTTRPISFVEVSATGLQCRSTKPLPWIERNCPISVLVWLCDVVWRGRIRLLLRWTIRPAIPVMRLEMCVSFLRLPSSYLPSIIQTLVIHG